MSVIVIALLATACTPSSDAVQPINGMTQSEFVSIMQDLGKADPEQRDSILTTHGTSEAELRKYMTALSADPIALSRTLDSLQVRIDRDRFPVPQKRPSAPLE